MGLFLGGILATILVGAFFYVKATRDLRKEANELRRLNTLILRALEQDGRVQLSRNEKGEIEGLAFDAKLTAGIEFGDSHETE